MERGSTFRVRKNDLDVSSKRVSADGSISMGSLSVNQEWHLLLTV